MDSTFPPNSTPPPPDDPSDSNGGASSAGGSNAPREETVRVKVRRQGRAQADRPGPIPLPIRVFRRLHWFALAWCAALAAGGLYLATGGLGWLTGLAQGFGLAFGVLLFAPAMLVARLTGRRRRMARVAGVLWGIGLVGTLHALVSALSVVGVLVAVLMILFLFASRRPAR